MLKRMLLNLAVLLVILSLIYFAVERFRPQPVSQPDVFIYLIDALRADHLGCYGYDRTTSPHIDAFAKDAVLFEQAQTTASVTPPAIISLLSGKQLAYRARSNQRPLSQDIVFISEILQDAGYRTHAISTNPFIAPTYGFNQGFHSFHVETAQTAAWVNSKARKILNNTPKDSPLFLYLHTFEPHAPYLPPPTNF